MAVKSMGQRWIEKDVELNHGVRFPTPTSPYVFLTDLLHSSDSTHRMAGQRASTMLNNYNLYVQPASHTFQNSLAFLERMISVEQNNEIAFIENKLTQLAQLNLVETGKINEIKQFLIQMKAAPSSVDYNRFISLLNTLMLTANDFSNRLKNLTSNNNKNNIDLRANLSSSISTLIDNFKGTRNQKKYQNSYEEIIRRLTSNYIENYDCGKILMQQINNLGLNATYGEIFTTTIAIVQDALVNYLLKHGEIEYQKGELGQDKFQQELSRLEKQLRYFEMSEEAQQLKNIDANFIQKARDIFGISISTPTQKKRKYTDKYAEAFVNKQKRGFKSQLDAVRIVPKKQSFSNVSLIEELLTQLQQSRSIVTGSKNLATDAIFVTDFSGVNFQRDNLQDDIILSSLENLYKDISTTSSPQFIADQYVSTFEKLNSFLKDMQTSFIVHESTKFYLSLEHGKNREFSGREMSIFHYLDEAAYTGSFNPTVLTFMAMNLATDAIGAANKEPLETYLSIFAGLIMFDDFAVVAKNLTNQIDLSNIKNIHLYKLQSMYFPASYFLQMTYNRLLNMEQELYNDNAFRTNITVPTINYNESLKKSGIPMQTRWEMVKAEAEKNTKIKIAFGKSFLSLLEQLSAF